MDRFLSSAFRAHCSARLPLCLLPVSHHTVKRDREYFLGRVIGEYLYFALDTSGFTVALSIERQFVFFPIFDSRKLRRDVGIRALDVHNMDRL